MSDLVGNHIVGFPTRRLNYHSVHDNMKRYVDRVSNVGGRIIVVLYVSVGKRLALFRPRIG